MAKCLYCGKSLDDKRKGTKYCSDQHRVYFRRKEQRLKKTLEEWEMKMHGNLTYERMKSVLPSTTDLIRSFAAINGSECAEAAIELCMTAYAETVKLSAKLLPSVGK